MVLAAIKSRHDSPLNIYDLELYKNTIYLPKIIFKLKLNPKSHIDYYN